MSCLALRNKLSWFLHVHEKHKMGFALKALLICLAQLKQGKCLLFNDK